MLLSDILTSKVYLHLTFSKCYTTSFKYNSLKKIINGLTIPTIYTILPSQIK